MSRTLVLVYGVVCYLLFFATFLYFMGWLTGVVVPIDINTFEVDGKLLTDRLEESRLTAILINVSIMALFAVQHTIMARDGFKAKFTQIVPSGAERPTFVLLATLIIVLLMWQWRPIPALAAEPLWHIEGAMAHVLTAIAFLGFGIVLLSSFLINHFHLFGLQQAYCYYKDQPVPETSFRTPLLYRWVRHPLMLGLLIAFWAAPSMTQGRLTLAVTFTVYIFFGLWFEERTLAKHLGDDYRDYQKTTSMIIPMPPKSS